MRKKITLALLSLLLVPLAMMAQSVTISPSTGNLVAALSNDQSSSYTEVGFARGWSALWRHEQLPMNLVVADVPDLTEGGEIENPAGNLNTDGNGHLHIIGGNASDCYITLSLPKGYRFKGYKIEMLNNLNGVTGYKGFDFGSITKTLVELAPPSEGQQTFTSTVLATTEEMPATNGDETTYVLERDGNNGEWSNQLYFKIQRGSDAFYGITITSFVVYFTAEGTFEAPATSPVSKYIARSMVLSPFKTNKIDIGKVEKRSKTITEGNQQVTREFFAYTYENVKDLDAYTYIYQEEAIQDGTPMDVASEKKIFPVTINNKTYFAFGNGTYYVEPPTFVYSQTGLTYPMGYRVVGAKFTPQWYSGTVTPNPASEQKYQYFVQYTSGGTTYYLNDQLRFTTTRFGWDYNSGTATLSTGSGIYTRYLACEGSDDTRTLTLSTSADNYYNINVFRRSNTYYIGWDNDTASERFYLKGNTTGTLPTVEKGSTTNAAIIQTGSYITYNYPTFKSGNYKLTVYNKTGTAEAGSATVSSTGSGAGTPINLSAKSYGYNNDAIKFKIENLPDGCQALVDVSIFMQALNPYIDNMEITCSDSEMSLSQNFNAADFKVRGEEFDFYVPARLSNSDLTFTFSDLWSQYGDDTYYPGTDLQRDGYARYSFVRSPYFSAFDGKVNNKIAPRQGSVTWNNDATKDEGLYDARYVGTGTGTDIQPGAAIAYTHKVYADEAGNIRFKFNNADELLNTNVDSKAKYFEEYQFSVDKYIGSDDPDTNADGTATGKTGNFISCVMNATSHASDTYYVFTADETRYNIAPSKTWQHRYYAFYRMDINLLTETYSPKLTWTKVYDNTCYWKDNKDTFTSMWGLQVQTVKTDDTVIEGYVTTEELLAAIAADLKPAADEVEDHIPAEGETVSEEDLAKYDLDNDGDIDEDDVAAAEEAANSYPSSSDQILYIDGSDLFSIVSTSSKSLQDIKEDLAPNVLIYLPENTTSTLDNFATKVTSTSGSYYRAGKDIVITDKQPFYAPFDIQVDQDNIVKYDRQITWASAGKNTLQTVILPFTISVSNGKHTEEDGTAFTLNTMQASNCLSIDHAEDANAENFYAKATFVPLPNDVTLSEANVPYMVQVTSAPSDSQTPFKVSQKGALVKASVLPDAHKTDYLWEGETASGSINSKSYSFQNYGSYSGKSLPAADGYFYFARQMYLNSKNIRPEVSDKLLMYPFRAYFKYDGPTDAKRMGFMEIVFGENETNGVDAFERSVSLDENAPVYDIQGRMIAPAMRDLAGKKLPRGIYVVNGMKIIVK